MTQSAIVVDDDETIREIVTVCLADDFETTSFPDGRAFWDHLSERRDVTPDLIVLDVMMPGLDGIRVLRKLRNDDRFVDTVVVMLSSRGTADDVTKGLSAGADDYITKPFAPNVLRARIRKAMA